MSVIWGIPYLFIRIAVAELTPALLVFARTGVAALILLPIALGRGNLRPVLKRWHWVLAFAAVEIGLPWLLLGSAERSASSSLTGLLIAGVPLVTAALVAALGGGEGIQRSGLLGLGLGLAGVASIVGFSLRVTSVTALVEIGVVVVAYAVGPLILARRLGASRRWG